MALLASLTFLIIGFLIVKYQKFPVWIKMLHQSTFFYIEVSFGQLGGMFEAIIYERIEVIEGEVVLFFSVGHEKIVIGG